MRRPASSPRTVALLAGIAVTALSARAARAQETTDHTAPVSAVAVRTVGAEAASGERTVLVSGAADGTLRRARLERAKLLDAAAAGRLPGAIRDLALDPDGTAWIVCDDGAIAHLRPGASGPTELARHAGGAFAIALIEADGAVETIATGGADGSIRLFAPDGTAGRVLTGHAGPVTALAVADGRLVSVGWDGTLRVWDPKKGKAKTIKPASAPVGEGADRTMPPRELDAVAASPDGRRLASSGYDGVIRVWDAKRLRPTVLPERAHRQWIAELAFSPDGTLLAAAAIGEEAIHLVAPGAPERARTLPFSRVPASIAFTPDGTAVIVGCMSGAVRRVAVPDGVRAEPDRESRPGGRP